MGWYKTGVVSLVQGNNQVVGTGTDFVANVSPGGIFFAPDGRLYEVDSVTSATALTLVRSYAGANVNGSDYAIAPTQSYIVDLAKQVASLLSTFGPLRDDYQAGNIGPVAINAKANKGANSDITSLSGLTTPLSAAQGGTGNAAGAAAKLATPRNINGVPFDGTTNITVADGTKLPLTGGTITGNLSVTGTADVGGATVGAYTSLFTKGGSDPNFRLGFRNGAGSAVSTEQAAVGFQYSGTEVASIGFFRGGSANAGAIRFVMNTAEYLRLDSAGKIGFGTFIGRGNGYAGDTTSASSGTLDLYDTADGFTKLVNNYASGGIQQFTNGALRSTLDANGNFGLGVAPSSWGSSWKAFDIGAATGIAYGFGETDVTNNAYRTNAGSFVYKTTAAASSYNQSGGQHLWYTAPSGSAGAAISMTQAMTLDVNGLTLNSTLRANGPSNTGVAAVYDSTAGAGSYTAYKNSNNTYAYIGSSQQLVTGGALQDLAIRAESAMVFGIGSAEGMRLDNSKNLLVGVKSGSFHIVQKTVTNDGGQGIFGVQNGSGITAAAVAAVTGTGYSSTSSALYVNKSANTGRSINAAGTVNASGADYAEYMTKTDSCGVIAPGQIVGVSSSGKLTDKYADSVSFLIKSTNPSYVGGDTWGSEEVLGMARPVAPQLEYLIYEGSADPGPPPVEPVVPEGASDDETVQAYQDASAAYRKAMEQYTQAKILYLQDQAAHANQIAAAKRTFDEITYPAYVHALEVFNSVLETARQKVDRVAFCGQVPVNIAGGKPGQYVVPAQAGAGITGVLVDANAITLQQYLCAVGIVQNILPDGRANVRVKPV